MAQVQGAPEGSRLLYYPVKVGGIGTRALLDSGASVNCVDERLVAKAGGVIKGPVAGPLLYPDKRAADVRGLTQLEVVARGVQGSIDLLGGEGVGLACFAGSPVVTELEPHHQLADQGVVIQRWRQVAGLEGTRGRKRGGTGDDEDVSDERETSSHAPQRAGRGGGGSTPGDDPRVGERVFRSVPRA